MLKGTGFVVISNDSGYGHSEEFALIEEAQEHAAELAYRHGSAIIYAPVAVIKPKRDTVAVVPSKLLQQLKLKDKFDDEAEREVEGIVTDK